MRAGRSIHNSMKYHLLFMSMTAHYILQQMGCRVLEAMIFSIVSATLRDGDLLRTLEALSMIIKISFRFLSQPKEKKGIIHTKKRCPQGCRAVKFSRLKFLQSIRSNSEATM